MSAPLPATILSEVIEIGGIPGLKDNNPFSGFGKNKANLRKSLTALINKDPIDAYTGLGILYNYEGEFNLALQEFRKAYEISRGTYSQTRNYVNALLLVGEINLSLELIFKLFESFPNDKSIFQDIVSTISDYCIPEKIQPLISLSKNFHKITSEIKDTFQKTYEIEKFLKSNDISIDVYRKIKHQLIIVQNKFFTMNTVHEDRFFLDNEFNTLTSVIKIPKLYLNESDVVGKMNECLQDLIIDIYEEFSLNSLSSEDKLVFYFSIYEGENTNEC